MTAYTDIELIARHTIEERTRQPRITRTRTRKGLFGRRSRPIDSRAPAGE